MVVDTGFDENERRKQKWHGGFSTRRAAEVKRAKIVSDLQLGRICCARSAHPGRVGETELAPDDENAGEAVHVRLLPLEPGDARAAGSREPGAAAADGANAEHALRRALLNHGGERGPLAPKTVRYIHTIVHKALADAIDAGIIGANVAERAKPPRPNRSNSQKIECWEPAELAAFLESVKGTRLETGWRLAAMTGMRRGEVLGLRWCDVDLDASRIAVRNAIVSVAYEVLESSPKSHQARVIDLDPETTALLRRHREREREELGVDYDDLDLVTCAEDGNPIHPQSFSQAFATASERAGLRKIRLHDLRHTHATIAVKAGVPVKVISERLGHESPAFTLKQYAHVVPGMQAEAAELIAAVVAG